VSDGAVTAHELARQLLAVPDVPVGVSLRCHGCWGPRDGDKLYLQLERTSGGVSVTIYDSDREL
jgi:hypothetical protein